MEDQENNNVNNEGNSHNRRQTYRDLLNHVEDIVNTNDVGLQTVRKLKSILTETSDLNRECDIREKLPYPEEILLDSLVLSSTSNVLVKCTQGINVVTAKYEPLEFADKLAKKIRSDESIEPLDFIKLLEDARRIVPSVIEGNFLYGAYDFNSLPVQKERKLKVKQSQDTEPKKKLIVIKKQQGDQEEVDDTVIFLLKVLLDEFKNNNEQPLKYYDFVIDASSYSTTIENMFYFSFLVRDGRAKLDIDSNGVAIIRPSSKKELKSFRAQEGINTQMVVSFDMDQWNKHKSRHGHVQKHRKSK